MLGVKAAAGCDWFECWPQMSFLPFPSQPATISTAVCSSDSKYLAVAATAGLLDSNDQKVTTILPVVASDKW